ncbi:MAG: RHS repeat-associated core domain-containing protein [Xanthomarina sp.]
MKLISLLKTTSYPGNYIYEGFTGYESLKFFNHPQGYIEPNNSRSFDYIYQYKDHLGNIRLSYKNRSTNSNPVLEIQEENNYYPYGLKHKGYNNVVSSYSNSVASKFKYNGVEYEETLGLNLYEMYWRGYDASLGRFMQIDPLSELPIQIDLMPYSFAWNNPIVFSDPSGLCPDCGEIEKEGSTFTLENSSNYVVANGEWERSTVEVLEEVVVISSPSSTSDNENTDTLELNWVSSVGVSTGFALGGGFTMGLGFTFQA